MSWTEQLSKSNILANICVIFVLSFCFSPFLNEFFKELIRFLQVFTKIKECPVPNKDVLGGKIFEISKNVLDCY